MIYYNWDNCRMSLFNKLKDKNKWVYKVIIYVYIEDMFINNKYDYIMSRNKLLIKNVLFDEIKNESGLLIKLFKQDNNIWW